MTTPNLGQWIAEINNKDNVPKINSEIPKIGCVKKVEIEIKKRKQKRIAKWTQLKDPPHFPGLQPTPIYYQEDGKEYFLITPHYANDPNIYKYDIQKDEYTSFIPYPDTFQPNCHESVYIKATNELYHYGGYDRHFGILDLTTKKWDIKRDSKVKDKEDMEKWDVPGIIECASAYLPPPINEIHLFGFNQKAGNHNVTEHLKYDEKLEKFVVLHRFDSKIERPKILYIAKQQKLMVFGGNANKKIYFCEIKEKDQNKYEWKEYELKLPYYNLNKFDVVVAFETIVIVLYFGDERKSDKHNMKEIWCLDLQQNKWEKSLVKSPPNDASNAGLHLVKASDDWLHAIKCTSPAKHAKMKLFDLIPSVLYDAYSGKPEVLLCGYCKAFDIPMDIVEIILMHYPLFMSLSAWPNTWE